MRNFIVIVILKIILLQSIFVFAQQTSSVQDVVANILTRMGDELTSEEVDKLTREKVIAFLNREEKIILGTRFLTFRTDMPSTIYIAAAPGQLAPFWLSEQGFQKTTMTLQSNREGEFEIWEKKFPAGAVGLGVNSVAGGGRHYVVFIKSDNNKKLQITELNPVQHQVALADTGISLYVDRENLINKLPKILVGAKMIQTLRSNRDVGQLLGRLSTTRYPSSAAPDQLLLTWEGDPRTTQTISWRTDTTITQGFLAFQSKRDYQAFSPRKPVVKKSTMTRMITRDIVNNRIVNRHSITLTDLVPNTTYIYSVGDSIFNYWSDLYEFKTAPDRVEAFSFMYMGDPQNGLDRWGSLMQNANRLRPDIAFVLIAGDLVNRGAKRDDWDDFLDNAGVMAATKPFMPAIGNHDCQGGHPTLYLQLFHLPTNGPAALEPERVYSFAYSNALFVILDSNEDPLIQAAWMDEQFGQSQAKWKFVAFHHPIYSSSPTRDNAELRDAWIPIFDKHHVDMVLQGHDHAYLRTYPMKANQRTNSPKEGTVYVVSVSGTKMYTQGEYDYIEHGFTNTSTFQILDIQISGDRLVYRSYDLDGRVKDELVIEKKN